MSNPSKAAGTRYETAVCRAINEYAGAEVCERVVLHGSRDHGDLRLRVGELTLAVECKWRGRYPPESDMADFRAQALAEMANSGADGCALVVNRYRTGTERHEAWMPVATLALLMGWDVPARDAWACMTLAQLMRACFGRGAP